ncbi:hypothetical protein ACHAXN_011962 [Cyclotella atomus]
MPNFKFHLVHHVKPMNTGFSLLHTSHLYVDVGV